MMKLFLPKQHGAWAMLIIPFWLGAAASGFVWQHIPFFLGWLLLYLATYPMLLLFKKKKIPFYIKWTLIYMIPAVLLLLIPLWLRPSLFFFGLAMVPFFMINAYFSSKNRERALLNDLSAIVVFSLAGLASSFLADGVITAEAIKVFIVSLLFFAGCAFYVKSMIREKKNSQYQWISWSFHFLVPIIWALAGEWIVAAAFIPGLIRAVYFYGKPLSIMKLGIFEIVNAAIFFILILVSLFI